MSAFTYQAHGDRLRICLIGASATMPAEGMQNVYRHLCEELGKWAEVIGLDAQRLARGQGWSALRRFHPHIVHYVAGPSPASFLLTRAAQLAVPGARSVVSCIHPVGLGRGWSVHLARPNLVLTQAADTEEQFRRWGVRTRFVPNGVATDRFHPVGLEAKQALRRRYGLPLDRGVVLHVGHLKTGRNLLALAPLQGPDIQTVIVASPATKTEHSIKTRLERAGVIVWDHFIPRIEEIYQSADVYVFPTWDREQCIETPLSVLEAVSCGLPVVATPFGALPRLFPDGGSVHFVSDAADIVRRVRTIVDQSDSSLPTCARSFDWRYIGTLIMATYGEIGVHQ